MRKTLLGIMLALLSLFTPAFAAPDLKVDAIIVEGNVRSGEQAILRVMRTAINKPIIPTTLSEDIKRIYRLGFYADIQMELRVKNQKLTLVVRVEEKPSIRKIVYENNDALSEEELKEVVDIRQYAALSPTKLTQAAENIKDLYVEKGYFLAEVNWRLTKVENNQVDVTFDITEKEEVSVARIDIIDKSNDPDADAQNPINATYIKNRLETREGGLLVGIFGGGTFKADAFERDVTRIGHFYWDRGYIKAKVGSPKVELSADRREIYITIPVLRGKRFKTGALDITGDLLREKPELMEKVKLKTDEWFSTGLLRKSIENIGRIYKDEGYAYVNITPNTAIDDKSRAVNVTFNIVKGEKVRIERIDIVGNERTRDKVIRRELRLYEGEYYSTTGLERSQRLINRLGYFEPGSVRIQTRRGSSPNTMHLVIEVKEKPTGSFQVGAGFSTVENFVGQAQISQNNLFGRGQTLSFQGNFSSLRSIANIRF
ncbi:MAG: outer membrane protein assembly factor BamA, partial [Bradymonadia bacterium]